MRSGEPAGIEKILAGLQALKLNELRRAPGRPLVEIEFAEGLPPPDEGGFADVRRMLLSRMARG